MTHPTDEELDALVKRMENVSLQFDVPSRTILDSDVIRKAAAAITGLRVQLAEVQAELHGPIKHLSAQDYSNVIAHLSPELEPNGELPNRNSLMMALVEATNTARKDAARAEAALAASIPAVQETGIDIAAIENGGRRWHGEDHRVVAVRWEPYKPDGQRQMKAKGRWQEQVGSGDYWRWQNCDRPSALAASQPADPVTNASCCQTVRVKPLVWFEGDEPDEWKSGPYDVWCEFGKYQVYHWSIIMGKPHETAEAAKAAAQADYEARILSALEPAPVALADAMKDVFVERQRQISTEGWTPEHDDTHINGEMAQAAACYALNAAGWKTEALRGCWPMAWASAWFKPAIPRRDLVKAGAMIIAEIERLDRAALHAIKETTK